MVNGYGGPVPVHGRDSVEFNPEELAVGVSDHARGTAVTPFGNDVSVRE